MQLLFFFVNPFDIHFLCIDYRKRRELNKPEEAELPKPLDQSEEFEIVEGAGINYIIHTGIFKGGGGILLTLLSFLYEDM